jgi:microsomal dipeptidase-like Zn-dependent dipeptidase
MAYIEGQIIPKLVDLHNDFSESGGLPKFGIPGAVFGRNLLERSHDRGRPLSKRVKGAKEPALQLNNVDLPGMVHSEEIVFANACPFPLGVCKEGTTDFVEPVNYEKEYEKHKKVYDGLEMHVSDVVRFVRFKEELEPVAGDRRIALIQSVEGIQLSGNIRQDTDLLDRLMKDGVRNFGPMWNKKNVIGTHCYDENETRGLSDYGKDIVTYLAERGMILDVSHSNAQTARDILKIAPERVIATHCGARSLTDHRRNMPDDVLEGLGLVGVPFVAPFVRRPDEEVSVRDVVDHVQYLRRVIGVDRVGFGPDFGGTGASRRIEGLHHVAVAGVSLYKAMTETKEFSEEEIEKIFRGNGRSYLFEHLPQRPRADKN